MLDAPPRCTGGHPQPRGGRGREQRGRAARGLHQPAPALAERVRRRPGIRAAAARRAPGRRRGLPDPQPARAAAPRARQPSLAHVSTGGGARRGPWLGHRARVRAYAFVALAAAHGRAATAAGAAALRRPPSVRGAWEPCQALPGAGAGAAAAGRRHGQGRLCLRRRAAADDPRRLLLVSCAGACSNTDSPDAECCLALTETCIRCACSCRPVMRPCELCEAPAERRPGMPRLAPLQTPIT